MRANVESAHIPDDRFFKRQSLQLCGTRLAVAVLRLGSGNICLGCLGDAVGIEERAAEVNNGVAAPVHGQAGILGNDRHGSRLEVLLRRVGDKGLHVRLIEHHCHSLLRFGDSQLGAVETVIFLCYLVEVNGKTVGKLADGDAHAARAEVVAALDQLCHLGIAEQALYLALCGRIALLHLCAAGFNGAFGVRLGGACGAAAAVASRSAAEEDDHIVGQGHLADDVLLGRSADDRADLHALGNIALVVKLHYLTRRQTDLVAVGAVALRRARGDLARGQLAVERPVKGRGGVARACDAHRLINIRASRQRVADGAAEAGRRAAEGLDLGGMVMGFVLELHQPFLGLAVDGNGHLDGAGVDLVALVQIGDHALFLEGFHAHQRHIHQRYNAVGVLAVDLGAGGVVFVQRVLDHLAEGGFFYFNFTQTGEEGGVAAVV